MVVASVSLCRPKVLRGICGSANVFFAGAMALVWGTPLFAARCGFLRPTELNVFSGMTLGSICFVRSLSFSMTMLLNGEAAGLTSGGTLVGGM